MDKIVDSLMEATQDILEHIPDSILDCPPVKELLYSAMFKIDQLDNLTDGLYICSTDRNHIYNIHDNFEDLYYVNYNEKDSVIAALLYIESLAETYSNLIVTCLSRYIDEMTGNNLMDML